MSLRDPNTTTVRVTDQVVLDLTEAIEDQSIPDTIKLAEALAVLLRAGYVL